MSSGNAHEFAQKALDHLSGIERKPSRRWTDERMYRPASWETDPVLWRNTQWAVTSYGIENVAGPYHYYIERAGLHMRMGECGDWRDHMAEKNWVDVEMFNECFAQAVRIHGSTGQSHAA